jgi:hypothetical protein
MVFAFYLQDWNEGFNEWNELNPLSPRSSKKQTPPSGGFVFLNQAMQACLQKHDEKNAKTM